MLKCPKRTTITLRPEWEPVLKQLKRERFYDSTQAEMLRYIIEQGLESVEAERVKSKNGG